MGETSRRGVLAGAAGLSASFSRRAVPGRTTLPPPTRPGKPSRRARPATDGGGMAGRVFARTSDIPVGGGKIFPTEGVIVVQPAAGTFKGFSATCTHLDCTLSLLADGMIGCGCHGSQFSAMDGCQDRAGDPRPPREGPQDRG